MQHCQKVKRKVAKLTCFALTVCLLCLSNLWAQDPEHKGQRPRQVFPTRAQEPDDILRIDTDLVAVDCTVTDSTGRLIKNLQKQDFKLYADGMEQPLSFFQVERRTGQPRPLAIVFALDISGSMTSEEMVRLRGALQAFSMNVADHRLPTRSWRLA